MAYLSLMLEHLPISVEEVVTVLVLPGLFVAMIVGGNVHAFSLGVAATSNFVLYGALSYFVLGKMGSRRIMQSKHPVAGNAEHQVQGPVNGMTYTRSEIEEFKRRGLM